MPRPGLIVRFGSYLARVLPALRAERDGVAKLRAPKPDEARVDDLLARWDDVLGALRRANRGAKGGDDAVIALGLKGAHAADLRATAAARALDLEACTPFNPFTR